MLQAMTLLSQNVLLYLSYNTVHLAGRGLSWAPCFRAAPPPGLPSPWPSLQSETKEMELTKISTPPLESAPSTWDPGILFPRGHKPAFSVWTTSLDTSSWEQTTLPVCTPLGLKGDYLWGGDEAEVRRLEWPRCCVRGPPAMCGGARGGKTQCSGRWCVAAAVLLPWAQSYQGWVCPESIPSSHSAQSKNFVYICNS